MNTTSDPYSDFAEHPRFGRHPRVTGLGPDLESSEVHFPWHYKQKQVIPNTAIKANFDRQTPATVPATHYCDVQSKCRDCGRPFIFFAEEQKYWYEELGFSLHSQCLSCFPCRQKQHAIAHARSRYEELSHNRNRCSDENIQMAECGLQLIKEGVFSIKQTQQIRALLNTAKSQDATSSDLRVHELLAVTQQLESQT